MEFDFIIGNPPYQAPPSDKKSKGADIYKKITKRVLRLLAPDGSLAFLTPKSAITRRGNLSFIEREAQAQGFMLNYIDYQVDDYFDIGTSVVAWGVSTSTEYKDNNTQEENLRLSILYKSYKKPEVPLFKNGCNIVINKKYRHKTRSTKYKYHAWVNHKNHNKYWLSKKPDLYNILKIVVKASTDITPKNIIRSSDTFSEFYYVREVQPQDEYIEDLLLSLKPLRNFTACYEQGSSAIIGRIPDVKTLKEVYDHFEFTQEEIDYIEL